MKDRNAPSLQENKMGVMPVGKLLVNMAIPMILSMLVQALYNVVDSIYVSGISSTNDDAVIALGLAFPVQNMQIGFATGIAVGVNSLLSKALGEGDRERANRTAGNGIFLASVAIVIFMLFGLFGTGWYYSVQPASEHVAQYGKEYSTICCVFTAGVFIEILFERLLQASGRTVYTMITQGVGAIINILLDPVFIYGWFGIPAMGLAGAAVATVIGQWIAAILAVYFNVRFNHDVKLSFRSVRPDRKVIGGILTIGIPSIVMMAIGSVMNFSMNQILMGFEGVGETAAGAFGLYYKIQSFFFMPIFGLNNATISIIAFNYGARKPERITKTLKLAVSIAMGVMLMGTAAFVLMPNTLLGIFSPTPELAAIGATALRIIGIHFPLAAVGIALGASFQALGNGIYSTITSLSRQLLALLPAAYLLSLSGNVNLVWWAFPIAELVSMMVTLIFFARIYRQKVKPLFS